MFSRQQKNAKLKWFLKVTVDSSAFLLKALTVVLRIEDHFANSLTTSKRYLVEFVKGCFLNWK